MTRRKHAFIAALFFLLVCRLPLFGQGEIPREIVRQTEPAARKAGEEVFGKSGKSIDRDFEKYFEEEKKFYSEYSTVDRSYFSFFSSAAIKRPFNQLVDDAIVSIRASQAAKLYKNAGNQQIVDALARQNQTLAPPQRLKLELQPHRLLPDELDVSKPDGSASGSVRMSSLQDFISEAIDKITFPPSNPSLAGHINIDSGKLKLPPNLKVQPAQ